MFSVDSSFDLIVVGAGSGGLAAAKRAASYGARVAIIEGGQVGGTCVIRGCVPKKLLVYGSKYAKQLKSALSFGVDISQITIDSASLFENVRKEVHRLEKLHIELLSKAKVKLFSGWAYLNSENSVLIQNEGSKVYKELFADRILIAVGGKPTKPEIPGASLGWVSDDIFLLEKIPERVVVVGAGFIACEFACILNGLGIEVVQIVRGNCLLKEFDKDLSIFLEANMKRNGIDIQFNRSLVSLDGEVGNMDVILDNERNIKCHGTLFATGRKPNLSFLKIKKDLIQTDGQRIKVNDYGQTNLPGIFAVGDVSNRINLTPVAIEEGRCFSDREFGNKSRLINYEFIPKAVFSDPEISSVGLTEEQSIESFGKQKIKVFSSTFRPMSEALPKGDNFCMLKLVVNLDTNKILGCHMAGEGSAEIIQMASIAISMGATKQDFDKTMALHPTISEEFVTMT